MGSIGLGASALTGLWEFASHIHAITVTGTTVRLVALMGPTGQAVLRTSRLAAFALIDRNSHPTVEIQHRHFPFSKLGCGHPISGNNALIRIDLLSAVP
jgi:hypothetical protein